MRAALIGTVAFTATIAVLSLAGEAALQWPLLPQAFLGYLWSIAAAYFTGRMGWFSGASGRPGEQE